MNKLLLNNLKENEDNWCIWITEISLPYINEVRSKNSSLPVNDIFLNHYCKWENLELIITNENIKKSYKEITLKEFIDKFSLNYLTKRLEDNIEKQVDLLNDEFIVDCKRVEETTQVYGWLIKTRNYNLSTYTKESLIKQNLTVVCNKEDGKSFYHDLTIAKSKFRNHPVYTFNQFKEMYLNPEIKTNNTQKLIISRTDLLEIYNIACRDWKTKIKEDYFSRVDLLSDNIIFEQTEINEMFNACTDSQRPVLVRIFGNPIKFKVGDYIICETAKTPKANKIIEITNTHYMISNLVGYDVSNRDLRLATEQEIKRSKINWENIKTGSVVKLKRTSSVCNYDTNLFDFNASFQVVFYKKPFIIDQESQFKTQHLSYSSYCTFYQNGKFILYSAHKNVDYITEVISY